MLVSRDIKNYDELIKQRVVPGVFLQSTFWRSFLDKQNKRWWQLTITDNLDRLIAVCLLYENKLFLGKSYLYSPKGPLWLVDDLTTGEKQEALELILSQIRDITIATHEREELFCKIEMESELPTPPQLVKSQNVQPPCTWVLDLDKEPKELLGNMHAKTRYNIALAQRQGVRVFIGQQKEDIKHFLKLLSGTAKRQGVKFHSASYYKNLWETALEQKVGVLYLAEAKGKIIAANLIIDFGEITTYLHGVSDYKFRKIMAPHLLQWQAIKDAKEKGRKLYDFWGVCNEQGLPKNWQGLTRFKQGFGGRMLCAPGAYNYIYNKQWYKIYLQTKNLLRIFR